MRPEEHSEASRKELDEQVPVVGIGASAGGLRAYKELLQRLPSDTGFAFVLVQHLDPTHESLMVELLAKHTAMPVREIADGVGLEPDRVYMIPPDAFVSLHGRSLRLEPPQASARGVRMAVDHFFRSLAEDRGKLALGIVLSGTGSDGTAGLRAIRARGGLTIAQRPATAEHEGMPHSAVAAGVADLVLSIEEMPEALRRFSAHPYLRGPVESEEREPIGRGDLDAVAALLKARTRFDGTLYKSSTVARRVQRRMGLRHVSTLGDYVRMLREQPEELELLVRDLLISVTDFFRDAPTFDHFCQHVVPGIVSSVPEDGPVRIWVPACATGEEAYSLAMCFLEAIDDADRRIELQVFATDVDECALGVARAAVYPASALENVSRERLQAFFAPSDDQRYRIVRRVRDCVSFASHDVLHDAPFSRMDMISCRNLLIYLRREVQARVVNLFHFSLRPDGVLLLGSSETPSIGSDAFVPISKENHVYRRVGRNRRTELRLFAGDGERLGRVEQRPARAPEIHDLAARVVLGACKVAAAVVDRDAHVLYLHGPVGRYLDLPQGEMRSDLFAMLSDELRSRVRAGVYRALRGEDEVGFVCEHAGPDGSVQRVRVRIEASRARETEGLLAVVFGPAEERGSRPPAPTPEEASLVAQLEEELESTREDLRTTLEELETSNEELKSSNEETISMNEELQSSNEELEASAEELRSLNEELTTVNQQLREKVGELEDANNDLGNFFSSTKLATAFLDTDLSIKRFTPAAGSMLGIRTQDVGRPLSAFVRGLDPDLEPAAARVLESLASEEVELRGPGDTWLRRAILPYRTEDNRISGVVVTFTDITQLRRSVDELSTRARQQAATADLGQSALQERSQLEILLQRVPPMVAEILGVEYAKVLELLPEGEGFLLRSGYGWRAGLVGNARLPNDQSQAGHTLNVREPVVVHDLLTESRFSGPPLLLEHGVRSGMSCVIEGPNGPWGVLGAHTTSIRAFSRDDVHFLRSIAHILSATIQRAEAVTTLRQSEARLRLAKEAAALGIHDYDIVNDRILWDERVRELWGADHDEPIRYRTFLDGLHPDDRERTDAVIRGALAHGKSEVQCEYRVIHRRDGRTRWILATGRISYASGRPERLVGTVQDITERKTTEQSLQQQNLLLAEEDRRKEFFLATLGHELRNPLAAIDGSLRVLEADLAPAAEIVPKMKGHVGHLTNLVNDLLDLARVTRGKITLRREAVDLAGIVRMAAEGIGPRAREKDLELVLELPAELWVDGDATRLEQVVGNLLGNAVKFTARGGRVEVAARVSGGEAVLEIRDDGKGMTSEELRTAFQPFTQGNPGDGGLGIELSLVFGLVHLHGGSVSAHSEGLGHGTTVVVRLPVGAPGERGSDGAAAPRGSFERARILVVDDVNDSADSLALLLRAQGAETRCAYTGEDAVAIACEWRPHVALIDIGLPDISGLEVATRILGELGFYGMLLVAVTGFGDPGAEERAIRAGFHARIVKPIDHDKLREMVSRYMADR